MKPRTKIQKEVYSYRLPRLTGQQREVIKEDLFPHYMYKLKDSTTCMSCGHRWANNTKESALAAALLGDSCPKCNRKLSQHPQRKKRSLKEERHVCHITTYKNFQIFRYWFVKRKCKVLEKPQYFILEVQQTWIREDGKTVDVARLVNSFNYGQAWQLGSYLEVRGSGYDIPVDKYLPRKSTLKVLRRNGYTGSTYGLIPSFFCSIILSDPKAETLLKSKQIELLNNYGRYKDAIHKYWPSIKIAIRHSFTVKNVSDWFDHLRIMERFGNDILNPSLICPDNFTTAHQKLVDKRNRIDAKIAYEKRKEQIAKDNIEYTKQKQKYFDLCFHVGDITVKPLVHVKEFYDEAEAMHHCVSDYYTKEESLILSAQADGERLETIEVCLQDYVVAQCRGLKNKETKHHDQIVELVERNMKSIRKLSKTKTKK